MRMLGIGPYYRDTRTSSPSSYSSVKTWNARMSSSVQKLPSSVVSYTSRSDSDTYSEVTVSVNSDISISSCSNQKGSQGLGSSCRMNGSSRLAVAPHAKGRFGKLKGLSLEDTMAMRRLKTEEDISKGRSTTQKHIETHQGKDDLKQDRQDGIHDFMLVRAKLKKAKSKRAPYAKEYERSKNKNERDSVVNSTQFQILHQIGAIECIASVRENVIHRGEEAIIDHNSSNHKDSEILLDPLKERARSSSCDHVIDTRMSDKKEIKDKLHLLFANRQAQMGDSSHAIGAANKRGKITKNTSKFIRSAPTDSIPHAIETQHKDKMCLELNRLFQNRIESSRDDDVISDRGDSSERDTSTMDDERDDNDPRIMDLAPMKTFKSQQKLDKRSDDEEKNSLVPSKDNPEHQKYFKMLKMGLPMGAVQNAMKRDGLDPSLLFPSDCETSSAAKPKKDMFRRVRLHWTKIPEDSITMDCIWYQVKLDEDIKSIYIDEEEFDSLFKAKPNSVPRMSPVSAQYGEKAVKVINPKRAQNGAIVLARIRLSYASIAGEIAKLNHSIFTNQQLFGIMEYIPTSEERKLLEIYLENNSFTQLCECEKFMTVIARVENPRKKIEAMLFKMDFMPLMSELSNGIACLTAACNEILTSVRFRKLLGCILVIGNRLNAPGETDKVSSSGFSMTTLSCLSQVKAFDKKTSILLYVCKLVEDLKMNCSPLDLREELASVIQCNADMVYYIPQRIQKLENDLKGVSQNFNESESTMSDFLLEAHALVNALNCSKKVFEQKFKSVLNYLAESNDLDVKDLFQIIAQFCHDIKDCVASNMNEPKTKHW